MKKSILLIDDENVFHFVNSKIITLAGIDCEIQTASNGQDALELIHKKLVMSTPIPDFIFVDISMPIMDGFAFVEAFNGMQIDHKEKITIAILTSSIDPRDRARAEALKVRHFITKPLAEEDVKAIVL